MFQTSSEAVHLPLICQSFPVSIGTVSHPNVMLAIQDTLLSMEDVSKPAGVPQKNYLMEIASQSTQHLALLLNTSMNRDTVLRHIAKLYRVEFVSVVSGDTK